MRGTWLEGLRLPRRSVVDELRKAELDRPDREVLRWHGGRWTVAELGAHARAFANGLRALGVEPGDRVANVVETSSAQFMALKYGIALAGAVEVPINAWLRGPLLRHCLTDCDPKTVLVEPHLVPFVEESGGLATDMHVFDDALFAQFAAAPAIEHADPAADELAVISYTSGTTGPSKGVMLPHGYPVGHGELWRVGLDITEDDVMYFFLPMFHGDALCIFALCLLSGSVFAFRSGFSASAFWDDVREFDASWTGAVGSVLSVLVEKGKPEFYDSLRLDRCVVAPIPPEAYTFFEDELGIRLVEIFAQTEANTQTWGTPDRRKRGSAGWPCMGFDVTTLKDDGTEAAPGETGEIACRPGAPNLTTMGYWLRPEATAASWRDMWLHTGDLGYFDEDGFLFYVGRKKDVIRRRGENISCFELETTIREAPGVKDCVAVPVPDPVGGEDDVKAYVVLDEGGGFDLASFFDYCERNLAKFAVPRFVEPIEESALSRGPGTGAVQKHLLPKEHGPDMVDRLELQK